jgi:hypothetical protein
MLAGKSPLIGISIPLIDELSDFSLLRQASATPSVCGERHKTVINRRLKLVRADELGVGNASSP